MNTEYDFAEESTTLPGVEEGKVSLTELEYVFDSHVEWFEEDSIFQVNEDKQRKTFHCTVTGKDVSSYNDAMRHWFAKIFEPKTERDFELVKACGGKVSG